jgi:hypothetical protein
MTLPAPALPRRVYTRRDTLVVGALSVNITGCPRGAAAAPAGGGPEPGQALSPVAASLHAAVSALVPRCAALPVNVEQACPRRCGTQCQGRVTHARQQLLRCALSTQAHGPW